MAFLTKMSRIPHLITYMHDLYLIYFLCHYHYHYHYYIYLCICIHNMGDISFTDTT